MKKILYIETNMGAAGDMLLASLYELMDDKESFTQKLSDLSIPGVSYKPIKEKTCNIVGTRMCVDIHGEEEESVDIDVVDIHDEHRSESNHEHSHEMEHEKKHNHAHHGFHQVSDFISHLPVDQKVRSDAVSVYEKLRNAEAAVHGMPVDQIHFHEVGTLDAIADVVGVCLAIAEINPDVIMCSPVNVGSGQVRCAHGIMPVPAPATAELLKGIPIYSNGIRGELCTPTGAALLTYFADNFGPMPKMSYNKIGYGIGKKKFEAANCVRSFLGKEGDR